LPVSRFLALILCGTLPVGCSGPKPFLLSGDAKRVEVGYASDPATTFPLAKAHCAQYERVPRLLQAQENIAYYECYKP
jgi:hypothetical protein